MVLITSALFDEQILDGNECRWDPVDRKEFIMYLHVLLNSCARASTPKHKKEITHKLLRSIWKNLWFLLENMKFKQCLFDKLRYLYRYDCWDIAGIFLRHMSIACIKSNDMNSRVWSTAIQM
jgi:hypothetical protein